MLPSRLLAAVVLLITLATLPGPSDGTLAYLTMPVALIGLPFSQLALGLGLAGVKIAIASRLLRFLFGVMFRSGPERGISVRKEFVHVPARDLRPRPLTPAVEPVLLSGPPLPPPPPLRQRAFVSPFSLPQPYQLPEPQPFIAARNGLPATNAVFASGPLPALQPPLPPFLPPPPPLHFVVPPPLAIALPEPAQKPPPASKVLLPDAQPATGGAFDQVLKIAQSPAVSTILSNNPELFVRFLQGFVGVKPKQTPLGTAHSSAGLTGSKIGNGEIEALIGFVRDDPNLVRNIVKADPGFIPSLVNNLLGISNQRKQEPTPAPPENFPSFDLKKSSNHTDEEASKVPANVPIDSAKNEPTAAPPPVRKTGRKPTAFPARPYSLLGYRPTFYTIPNSRQPPVEIFRFPSKFGDVEQPIYFSRTPWHTATLLGHLGMPKLAARIRDAYRNKQRGKTYGPAENGKLTSLYQTPITTIRPDQATVEVHGSVSNDKPKSLYQTEVTTVRPDVRGIRFPSKVGAVEQPIYSSRAPWHTATLLGHLGMPKLAARIRDAYRNKQRGKTYGPAENRKLTSLYQTPITTTGPDQATVEVHGSVNDKPKSLYQTEVTTVRPEVHVIHESKEVQKADSPYQAPVTTTSPDEPSIQNYGSSREEKPKSTYQTKVTTAHSSIQADRTVKKDKPKSYFQTEATTEVPIIQAHRSGPSDQPVSSYDKPQPSTNADFNNDPADSTVEIVVVTEEPQLEQDLPTSEELNGDIYAPPSYDNRNSLPSAKVQHVAELPEKQTDAVFVPVTGKFRFDQLRDTPLKYNVTGPPAALHNPTAHSSTREKGPAPKDQLKAPYEIDMTPKLPIVEVFETGRSYQRPSSYDETVSSYDKPQSVPGTDVMKGPVDTDVQFAEVEEPVVEQDLPAPAGPKGDVYASGNHDGYTSLPSDEVEHVTRPPVKQMAVPPPVRSVFFPVTGKFRPELFGTTGVGENMGSFPAMLYDPTALDTEGPSKSGSAPGQAPPKPRKRRSTPGTSASAPLQKARHMNSRKCVFKMVCYIGANDQAFGRRFGENFSSLFRSAETLAGTSEVATDYSRAYEVGRTHGGEGCRIKYNSCPMTVVDLVSLSANFG